MLQISDLEPPLGSLRVGRSTRHEENAQRSVPEGQGRFEGQDIQKMGQTGDNGSDLIVFLSS